MRVDWGVRWMVVGGALQMGDGIQEEQALAFKV
jgi:hypothetical protein